MVPKRAEELIDGGSLFWVIRGEIACRQRLLAVRPYVDKSGIGQCHLVLAPKGEAWAEPPPGRVFRIVSEPLEGKGRQRYMGCGPEGRMGLALQTKHRTPENEAFFSLQRGDVVTVTETEPKGDGLGLSDRSSVQVLAEANRGLGK